jgi:hypothetical protein
MRRRRRTMTMTTRQQQNSYKPMNGTLSAFFCTTSHYGRPPIETSAVTESESRVQLKMCHTSHVICHSRDRGTIPALYLIQVRIRVQVGIQTDVPARSLNVIHSPNGHPTLAHILYTHRALSIPFAQSTKKQKNDITAQTTI